MPGQNRISKENFISMWLGDLKNKSSTTISKKLVDECYVSFIETVKKLLQENKEIALTKFCKIEMVTRKARESKNPKTGDIMTIKAKKVPKFKFSKTFIENVSE